MKTGFASEKDIRSATTPRRLRGSKADNGRVLIIAGSDEYHGAPALAANAAYNTLAALRIGTGYAFLYVPGCILDPVRRLSPSLIVRPFGRKGIGQGSLGSIKEAVSKANAVVIGMGIGRDDRTLRMAAKIIGHAKSLDRKIVIDADAIYSLKYVKRLYPNAVITPQDKEFREASKEYPGSGPLEGRAAQAVALARRLGCCVLLKGHTTIVTDGVRVKLVSSKSSALATMGTGDVLSGIIGGYAAAGASAFRAAVAGAYLHARIGDALHKAKGNHILSSDLAELIPSVLKKFDRDS